MRLKNEKSYHPETAIDNILENTLLGTFPNVSTQEQYVEWHQRGLPWEFPGGTVVRTPHSHC